MPLLRRVENWRVNVASSRVLILRWRRKRLSESRGMRARDPPAAFTSLASFTSHISVTWTWSRRSFSRASRAVSASTMPFLPFPVVLRARYSKMGILKHVQLRHAEHFLNGGLSFLHLSGAVHSKRLEAPLDR